MTNSQVPQFTAEEIEKMRSLVLAHDKEKNAVNVFDPNNPPKVPYSHKEFPKVVYDHKASKPSRDKLVMQHGTEHVQHVPAKLATKNVNNQAELDAALAEGWELKPPVLEHVGIIPEEDLEVIPEDEDDPELQQEAAARKQRERVAKAKKQAAQTA